MSTDPFSLDINGMKLEWTRNTMRRIGAGAWATKGNPGNFTLCSSQIPLFKQLDFNRIAVLAVHALYSYIPCMSSCYIVLDLVLYCHDGNQTFSIYCDTRYLRSNSILINLFPWAYNILLRSHSLAKRCSNYRKRSENA